MDKTLLKHKTAPVISHESRRLRVTNGELEELELVEPGSAVVDQFPEAVGSEAVDGVLEVVCCGTTERGEPTGLGELEHSLNEVCNFLVVPAEDVEQGDERVLGAILHASPTVAEHRLLSSSGKIRGFGPLRDEHAVSPVFHRPQIAMDAVMGVDFSSGVDVVVVERRNPELPEKVVRGNGCWRSKDELI